jgi:hypothetical protein
MNIKGGLLEGEIQWEWRRYKDKVFGEANMTKVHNMYV